MNTILAVVLVVLVAFLLLSWHQAHKADRRLAKFSREMDAARSRVALKHGRTSTMQVQPSNEADQPPHQVF